MTSRISSALLGMATFATLASCATTKEALEQANGGAALTVSLQHEMDEFRRVQAAVAAGRLDSIRNQRRMLASFSADSAVDERLLKASGKTDSAKLYAILKQLADARAAEDRARQAEMQAIDEQLAKVVSPVPDTTTKIQATQKALAVLGKELSEKDLTQLALDFAGEIKASVDRNRKKIDEARPASREAGTSSISN